MSLSGYEVISVAGDYITVDLLVWRRYRTRAPRMVEITYDVNPHLARDPEIRKACPFIPVGTLIRLPIDPDILRGVPSSYSAPNLWGAVD